MNDKPIVDSRDAEIEALRAEVERLLSAVQFAYGEAWRIVDEPGLDVFSTRAPMPVFTGESASYSIRKRLLQVLTEDQKCDAIKQSIERRCVEQSAIKDQSND